MHKLDLIELSLYKNVHGIKSLKKNSAICNDYENLPSSPTFVIPLRFNVPAYLANFSENV